MMKYTTIFLFLVIAFSSCFKEDDPIAPHPKSDLEKEVIPLTLYYVNQVYFKLSTGEQVSMNQKNDFDLSFSCADTASIIRLNTSTFMSVALTEFSSFDQPIDTSGLEWNFDRSDGNPDSTALKDWINFDGSDTNYINKVWVVNRGINAGGFTLGLKKVIFKELNNGKYYFTFANMDNTEMKEMVIEKNEGYNYIQFSFDGGGYIEQLEPTIENWDLLFTQYTTIVYTNDGVPYPYLVTGALTNPSGTLVAFDSTMVFNDIIIDDVLYLDYSSNMDAIGYEWKLLIGDVNEGDTYYRTLSNYNYLIRSQKGIYYKLHFTGFYHEETGIKGYPTFEFQRL